MTGPNDASFRERHLTAQDGLRLYYRDYGDEGLEATPVLCLSGLTRNAKDFHGLASRLSAERRRAVRDRPAAPASPAAPPAGRRNAG